MQEYNVKNEKQFYLVLLKVIFSRVFADLKQKKFVDALARPSSYWKNSTEIGKLN
jgi:hypothetical protein